MNYRAGLFRMWLVLSLFWVAISAGEGLAWGFIIGVPLVFSIVLYLIVWAIRGFTVKQPTAAPTVDVRKLRQDFETENPEAYETYKTELEPVLNQLEAKFGNNVPVNEIDGVRHIIRSKLASLEEQRQEIINQGARDGKTIEIESLRCRLQDSQAIYSGPDRDTYVIEVDKLLESLTAKYGSRIPLDHAYKIVQNLEEGLGFTLESRSL